MQYRFTRADLKQAITDSSAVVGVAGAGIAGSNTGSEAFRSIHYDELPPDIKAQLKQDGTRGDLRTDAEAEAVYDQMVPAEAKGDLDAIRSITNDPDIHWGHIEPHSQGGSADASNGVYMDGKTNAEIGDRAMLENEIDDAKALTSEIAKENSVGSTGDLGEVLGDTAEIAALGGIVGAGLGAAHRVVQAKGYRDAGREDLAKKAEEKIAADAVGGAVNASIRGTSMAAVQVIAGANPFTAGIGLMGPEIVGLVKDHNKLNESEKVDRVVSISGKCAMAAGLVALGPAGFLGLGALSLWRAYQSGKGASQALPSIKGAG